jgi:1,4-alpha-glucan branching enzyme
MTPAPQDGTGVVQVDPWLEPYAEALRHRYKGFLQWMDIFNQYEGGLAKFAQAYEIMGFNVLPNGDITYREWAPNATTAHLIGDFSTPPLYQELP